MKIKRKYSNIENIVLTFREREVAQALEEFAVKHFKGWIGKLPIEKPNFDWTNIQGGGNVGEDELTLSCVLVYTFSSESNGVPAETPTIPDEIICKWERAEDESE